MIADDEAARVDSPIYAPPPPNVLLFCFVFRKEGSKTKKRTKEEEIRKGDYGSPTRKVFCLTCS